MKNLRIKSVEMNYDINQKHAVVITGEILDRDKGIVHEFTWKVPDSSTEHPSIYSDIFPLTQLFFNNIQKSVEDCILS